ncbi:MAG: hypothetical protein PHQ23_12920 [Candidatus Wallbacteria bacterium]|nr:hypothetical protein [Candidatus Wallbacteria bacterium]
MRLDLLLLLIIWITSALKAEKVIYFEAPTSKSIKVPYVSQTVTFKRTIEVWSEDLFAVTVDDAWNKTAGPVRLTSSLSREILPVSNTRGGSHEVEFCSIGFDWIDLEGAQPAPSEIKRLKFDLSGGDALNTTESIVVTDPCHRYPCHSPTFSPVTGEYMAYLCVQAFNKYQLWILNSAEGSSIRVAEDFNGSICEPSWGEDTAENSLILFENRYKISGFDYKNTATFNIVNPKDQQGANDYLNQTGYETMGRPDLELTAATLLFLGNSRDLVLADFSASGKTVTNPTVLTGLPQKGYDLSQDATAVVAALYNGKKFTLAVISTADKSLQWIDTGDLEPANPCWD